MEKTSKKFDLVSFITESLMIILACLLKPITSIKSKINEYADVKNAGLLVILVSLCRMIIGLLSAMITAIFVKQRNLFKGTTSLEVSFDGLKELDYFGLIVKQFVGFIIVVAAVAGIYYVVACVMKKTVNYFKLVSIATVSFIPLFIAGFVVTIVNYFYIPLAVFIYFAALVYSLITFIKSTNDEMKLEGNMVVYIQTICMTVIFVITYYVLSNYLTSLFGSLF